MPIETTPQIDLFADGPLITAQKILMLANDGTYFEGGLDFPSSSIVYHTHRTESHLHVDIDMERNYGEEPSDMDWINDIVPHDYVREPVPDASDPPFSYAEGESRAPGIFGSALRSFGEAAAALSKYGHDIKPLTKYFKVAWAIDDEFDEILTTALPQARSKTQLSGVDLEDM